MTYYTNSRTTFGVFPNDVTLTKPTQFQGPSGDSQTLSRQNPPAGKSLPPEPPVEKPPECEGT